MKDPIFKWAGDIPGVACIATGLRGGRPAATSATTGG